MKTETTTPTIRRVMRCVEILSGYVAPINELAPLYHDAGGPLDSLDRVELCMNVEDEFDLLITDASWRELQTIGSIVAYIDGRILNRR